LFRLVCTTGARQVEKAIRVPSGDHEGQYALAVPVRSSRRPVPSARIV
jgi:hypothetical protein